MLSPDNFLKGFEEVKAAREERAADTFRIKILKKYFPALMEGLDIKRMMYDPGIEDVLSEIKHRIGDPFLSSIFIEDIKNIKLLNLVHNFPKTEVWARFFELTRQEGKIALIFPVKHIGIWVMHGFGDSAKPEIGSSKIIWPSKGTTNIALQKIDTFIKEF